MSGIASVANERAPLKGIYRCTGLGYTRFREQGDELTPCECKEEKHGWEFILQDNISHDEGEVVFVGKGLIASTVIKDLPRVGETLNLRGPGLRHGSLYNGSYRVTSIGVLKTRKGEEFFHLFVDEQAGEIDKTKPICVLLQLQTC